MLRKGLVALMMGVICAGSAVAADTAAGKRSPESAGILSRWKNRTPHEPQAGGASDSARPSAVATTSKVKGEKIQRAVALDAGRKPVGVRQTSAGGQDFQGGGLPVAVAPQSDLWPVPVENAPVLPNISAVAGPQYFSAMPAGSSNAIPVHPGSNWQTYQAPMQIQDVSQGQYVYPASATSPAGPACMDGGMLTQTGAALYPSPVPGIPQQIGGAAIMNQAFHPHEMLYPHEYHAMYPPYYYKVNGGFMMTPFRMWSHEDWTLQGTQVDVKYKSHISPFTLFHPTYHR